MGENVRLPEHAVVRDRVIVRQLWIAELLMHRKGPDK